MRTIATIAMAAILAVTPVSAQDTFSAPAEPEEVTSHELPNYWRLTIMKSVTGALYCILTKSYDTSRDLRRKLGAKNMLMMLKGFNFGDRSVYYFELASDGFKVTKGKKYNGFMYFSYRKDLKIKGFKGPEVEYEGTSDSIVGTPMSPSMMKDIKGATTLNPVIGKLDVGYFPLTGSANAVSVLEACTQNVATPASGSGGDAGETF